MESLAEQPVYQFVDDIQEVAEARASIRSDAEYLLESRRQNPAMLGEHEHLAVDALSTGRRVLFAAEEYGESSLEYKNTRSGLVLDCLRLVTEWNRRLKPEHFPKLRQQFDHHTNAFFSNGMLIQQMTENGLVPMPDHPEEEHRRVNEQVEERTPQIVRSLGAFTTQTAIRTISMCTDEAIAAYQTDVQKGNPYQGYFGYVPEIEKMMIRDLTFEDQTHDRFEEQVSLPGTYITRDIIDMTLADGGADSAALTKTELHGAQLLARDRLMDFVARLDAKASEQWCVPIFMGEVVDADHSKDYDQFWAEAAERQEDLDHEARLAAAFVLEEARESEDGQLSRQRVEWFVKSLLIDRVKIRPEEAAHVFDAATAEGIRQVLSLEQQGRYEEAASLLQKVESQAPSGGCGVGSCEMERVTQVGEELDRLKEKLNYRPGDKIVRDNGRPCKGCGKRGSVYYSYKATGTVHKYCDGCGAKN